MENTKPKKQKNNKAPQGDSKETKEISIRFGTLAGTIEELSPEEIQVFPLIPDYEEPTSSIMPIVVKSPSSCHCIDGSELIEEAKERKLPKIACYVFHAAALSDQELAIRKVAIRTLPQGGIASYSEIVRNVRFIYGFLSSSRDNPMIYSSGGLQDTNNREENIRLILAERLGKSVATVDQYLSHGEYLNDSALNTLAESREEEDFFEKAQPIKTILFKNLRHEGLSDQEITGRISGIFLNMKEEYRENHKITRDRWIGDCGGGNEGRDARRRSTRRRANPRKPPVFKYSPGATRPPEDLPVNMDETNKALKEALHRMEEIPDLKDDNLGHVADYMKGEIFRLSHIHHDISVLAGKLKSSSQKKGI